MTNYPELQDIIQAIKKYSALNPDCTFIFGFLSYKDSDDCCEECKEKIQIVDENKSCFGAFGYLEELRELSNLLRDTIEDSVEEDGYINF